MPHLSVRSLRGVVLVAALLAPSLGFTGPTHAQSGRAPASAAYGPVGKPIIKGPGITGEMVVTVPGVMAPNLLTSQSMTAFGNKENNYDTADNLVPIPIVILGSKATPAILDIFNTIAKYKPNNIILVGLPKGSAQTIINYAVATGALVYSNPKRTRIATLAALDKATNDDALFQVPYLVPRHTGANSGGESTGAPFAVPDVALPHSVDNSGDLPPIGDQGQLSNCVAWSTSYYYMTALEGQVHQDWDLSTPDHQFSPAFVYNQVNGGKDDGAFISDAMHLLQSKGDAPLSLFPEDNHDYTSHPGASVVTAASAYRIANFGYLILNDGNLPYNNDITPLKKVLASGNDFVVGMEVFDSLERYTGGVYDGPYQGDTKPDGHAMVVVGYDDNAEGTGIGAFLIANSWGPNYGEDGYVWISYDYFRQFADDAWAMSLSGGPSTSMAQHALPGAARAPMAVPAVRYGRGGLFRPAGAATKPRVTYYSDGQYKIIQNPARKDVIVALTFTYERDDADGNALEQHTYKTKVEVPLGVDWAVSQNYRLSDGAVVTGQVFFYSGDIPS